MERLDLLLFGATGFTGIRVAKDLAKWEEEREEVIKFTWGICGRSERKIKALLTQLQEMSVDTSKIPVFECDVSSGNARDVTCKANVVLNCTGPNTVLSGPIVKACIDTSTHYVDISAEKYHMLDIYEKYNKLAEDAKVLIIPACGFAVIPAISGLMYLENKFQGTLNSVECYTDIKIPKQAIVPCYNNCLVHSGTWESLVHELENHGAYMRLKQKIYPENVYAVERPEIRKSFFHVHAGRIWFPYPGPEREVVEYSQRYMYNKTVAKPYHYKMYTTVPYLFHLLAVIGFILYYYLSCLKCFRKLLIRYPGFFSLGYMNRQGPTEEMAQNTKFTMSFTGIGVDDKDVQKSMTVKVSGSNPGYDLTCKTLIESAFTLLRERTVMPPGGVLAAGAAFRDTQLLNSLIRNSGMKYE